MFTCFQGNQHWFYGLLQSFFVLHTLGRCMIFAFSASQLLSETEFRLTSPSHLKWKSKLGTTHVTSESNVKLQQGIWINWYQLWHFLSGSIASWCLELYCQADELGPLSQAERRLAYISVWDSNEGLSWLSTWRTILLLQSLILMTKTLHSVTSGNVHRNTSLHDEVGNPMYFMICLSSKDMTHSLYGSCVPWTPLYILFQPALAIYYTWWNRL